MNPPEIVSRSVRESNNKNSIDHVRHTDTRSPIRLGIWVLIIGFGSFLIWAGLAPLDEGVPCQGVVSIATKRKVVESLHGGQIAAVKVKEGQMVQKGDVLVIFDSLTAKARYDEIHEHYLGLRAAEGRLLAELQDVSSVSFHRDLLNDPDRKLAEAQMRSQRALFESRRTSLRILKEQLAAVRELAKDGYVPLSQQRDLELKVADMRSNSAAQLAQIQLEVNGDAEKTRALAQDLAETEVRAPVSGQVVGLQVQTVGAVVQPGQKIMDIVPVDEGLMIDAKVAPHLIDSIRQGLPVNISFSSFAHSPQLVVHGVVASVSRDIITESSGPVGPVASYYLARVAVTPEGLKTLGHRQMQPGMPVQVVIRTGERTLLTYLLSPLVKRVSASMKEE